MFCFYNKIHCVLLLFFFFSSPANVREAIMLRCEWRQVERWKMVLNFRFKTMLWCINVFYALSNRAQIESRCWTVAQSVVPCAYWLYWIFLLLFCFWRWDVPFKITCMSCWNLIKRSGTVVVCISVMFELWCNLKKKKLRVDWRVLLKLLNLGSKQQFVSLGSI